MRFFLHLGLFLSAGADLASTRAGINRGAIEANPLAGQQLGRQAAVAFGSATAMYFIARGIRRENPKLADGLEAGFVGVRAATVAHNLKVGGGGPAK